MTSIFGRNGVIIGDLRVRCAMRRCSWCGFVWMTYQWGVSFQNHCEAWECCWWIDKCWGEEPGTSGARDAILFALGYLRTPLRKAVAMAAARLRELVFRR